MKKAIWERELESWSQKFGNMFFGFLGMFFVVAFAMFFYEGCSYQMDSVVVEKEEGKEDFDPANWILFK